MCFIFMGRFMYDVRQRGVKHNTKQGNNDTKSRAGIFVRTTTKFYKLTQRRTDLGMLVVPYTPSVPLPQSF